MICNMKPSERIEEIREKIQGAKDSYSGAYILQAILDYLDEIHEQNKIKKYEEHNRLIRSVQV
jgi:hypothetical protein